MNNKFTHHLNLLFSLMILFSCCSSSGMIAISDSKYFKESPKIVYKDSRYFLRFRYAESNQILFYMESWSRIDNDKLIFYIPSTTSTGRRNGFLQLQEIKSQQKIDLIKKGKVFWGFDKQLTRMQVEETLVNLPNL